jgi:CspA family cold shock protein
MTGSVKRLVSDKGFGFVADERGAEYFFHRSAVERPGFDQLVEGDSVEFDANPEYPKGPRAERIRVRG